MRQTNKGPRPSRAAEKAAKRAIPVTSRQRIQAALEHREPDRTPIFEYVLQSPIAENILGRPYARDAAHWQRLCRDRGWELALEQLADDLLDLAAALGHDMLYVPHANAPPGAPRPQSEPPAAAPADPVEALIARNRQAAQAPAPDDRPFLIYPVLHDKMAERGIDLPLLAPAYGHGVWTDTDLMQTMALAPEVAHEHFALATQRSLARIDKYLALGVDHIGVGGDFAGNRPLISPAAYARFMVPEVRTLSRRIHAGGAFAVNASDGDLWPVIDDFLLGCEVDGYLEIDLHAGMDLGELKRRFGAQITFYGNLDCGNTLSFGSPDDVRRHTIECIEKGLGQGGHILCASNAITRSVPMENYAALVNAYRDYFALPRWRPGQA